MSDHAPRVPVPSADQTWLHMDRPNNLMHVHSLVWFEGSGPTFDDLRDLVRAQLVDRFPVFSRVAVERHGEWYWEPDSAFDLDQHVLLTPAPGDGTLEDLRTYLGSRFAAPFDRDRPLWSMELITGIADDPDSPRTVVFSRFHHALADGIRLVQLLLSLCETTADDALPPPVGREVAGGLLQAGADVVRRGVTDAWDLAAGIATGIGAGVLGLPRAVTRLGPAAFEQGWDLALHPGRLLDAASALTSVDNATANTVTEVTRVLTAGRSVRTAWSGTPGVEKRVAWLTGLELDRIREAGARYGGTVNDILLAVVSLALTRYLDEREAPVEEIRWLVPVSLTPFDADLPAELGNHFSLVFLRMPLGIHDPQQLVDVISEHMTRIKESAEPVVTFGIQWLVAEAPRSVAVALTNLFANKTVGVLTNVPGPRTPMTFAGAPVAGMLGWAPCSADNPLSLCIFSYAGAVSLGVAADAELVPDPDRIAELIRESFETLVGG